MRKKRKQKAIQSKKRRLHTKTRRKNHNPKKRAQRFFSRAVMWSWESEVDPATQERIAYGLGYHNGSWVALTSRDVGWVINAERRWLVCSRALCSNDGGTDKVWLEVDEAVTQGGALLNDLQPVYEQIREDVVAKIRPHWIADVGWIATTHPDAVAKLARRELKSSDADWYHYQMGEWAEVRRAEWQKLTDQMVQGVALRAVA